MYAKYEVSVSYGSKVIVKVKADNRPTDRQTENNMPRSFNPGGGGIKILVADVKQVVRDLNVTLHF